MRYQTVRREEAERLKEADANLRQAAEKVRKESYDKNLQLNATNAASAYNAGLILFETNRIDEALARFERARAASSDPGKIAFLDDLVRKARAQMR